MIRFASTPAETSCLISSLFTELRPICGRKEYLKYCLSEILKYVEKLDLELEGRIDFESILASYTSWTGHAGHGNSHHFIRRMDELFYSLFSKELEGYHGKTNIDVTRWRNREIRQHEVQ